MLLPPSAFFLIGLLIWGLRSWRTEQIEAAEHEVSRPAARWIT
jgi:Na+-transporting NADH:ubiquinone oxidoreductase subunit D